MTTTMSRADAIDEIEQAIEYIRHRGLIYNAGLVSKALVVLAGPPVITPAPATVATEWGEMEVSDGPVDRPMSIGERLDRVEDDLEDALRRLAAMERAGVGTMEREGVR